MKNKTAHLIYNPTSGPIWNSFKPSIVENFLKEKGWQVKVTPTEYQGHATEIAKDAVKNKTHLVIAAGGDGTINEVVQGLAGSDSVLSILPVGTTNVMARELNIPLNFQDALRIIPIGEESTIDLGVVNDRYFVLMVGIGFDAKLVNDVDSNLKKMTGVIAFAATSPLTMMKHKSSKLSITLWDKEGKKKKFKKISYQALVSNAPTYAISLTVSLAAKLNDGLLDLDIFKSDKLHKFAWKMISIAFITKKNDKEAVDNFQFQKMMLKADPPMPIQVDGDSYGYTPALIEVKPNYLKILRPKSS